MPKAIVKPSRRVRQIHGDQPPTPHTAASPAEWWEAVAAVPAVAARVAAIDPQGWRRLERAARIWRARLAPPDGPWEGVLTALSSQLGEQFGPTYIWSASRLEAFRTCGFYFYARHLLTLEVREEPAEGLNARQLGSIYHQILETVTRKIDQEKFEKMEPAELWQTVFEIADPLLATAPEKEGFRETPWWEQTRREIVDNVATTVRKLAGEDYRFYRAELSFGFSDRPLVLEKEGDRLRLRGFIDRVDRASDGRLRLIDYKLAGKASYSQAAFEKGRRLQLPLYVRAVEEALELGEVADGFYWHVQAGEPSGFTLRSAGEESLKTAAAFAWEAVEGIRSGQFIPHPPAGGCPDYCPAASFCWRYTPKSYF